MDHYLATQTYEDIYYLPPPEWLAGDELGSSARPRGPDLASRPDLLRRRVHERGRGEARFNYGESMLALDPDFRRVYRWVGVAGVYTPTGSPPEFIERSIDVLRRGVERFPDDGELAWDAGATITYELLPHLPRTIRAGSVSKAEGNEHMMAAARLGAGPDWLVITNATSLRKLGRADRELRHLEEMYAVVRDPKVKAQIEIRLSQLRDEAYAEAFRRANEEFEQTAIEEFPYMPSALYFFVADPIESTVGLEDPS